MTFIPDVAAGILIVTAIIGIVAAGVQQSMAQHSTPNEELFGYLMAVAGILAWIAFVVCRLLRWP